MRDKGTMRLLVCGGAGFIGSNFIHFLIEHQPEVAIVCYDELTYAGNLASLGTCLQHPHFEFVRGDINNAELLRHILQRCSIDHVINFAAETHVDRSIFQPLSFVDTNVHGTATILETLREVWTDPQAHRLVQVSTDEVFGSLGPHGSFDENSAYRPNSPYSASKAAADHLVDAYHTAYGLNTVVTHCTNNYGPYQYPEKLIPYMILAALEDRPLPIYGDGQNVRDWIHVKDHCSGVWAALTRGSTGRHYAFGSGCERTNLELVTLLCWLLDQKLGRSAEQATSRLMTFIQDRPGHDRRYALNPSRARTELGWEPVVDFEPGLTTTVRWYLEHREWWQPILERKAKLHFYHQ